ncbi:flagellar hook-length control protein FliK [Alteromonas sp. P256]|uniref:flagellar hook-length control protein FliK n=1 Tax=Alteromonas sp. P256 TaxID=3117399 RepID=UPI002FE373A7
MQQVAANKTDIAALPFSATSTAKAVGTGLDSQAKGQNTDAFNSLYQEAKSAGRDFVLNENARSVDNASRESDTRAERAEVNNKGTNAKGPENANKQSNNDSMLKDSSHRGFDFDNGKSPVNASVTVTEKEYTIGADGNKALTNEQISNEETGEPDWIALVEGITKSALGQAINDSSTQAINTEGGESSAIANAASELMSQLQSMEGDDVASNQTLADKLSALSDLLNKQITQTENTAESDGTDTLSELLAALTGSESSEGLQGDSPNANLEDAILDDAISEEISSEESAQKAFLLSLAQDALPTASDRLSKALSKENAGETATVQTDANIDKLHKELTDAEAKSQDAVTLQQLSASNTAAVSDIDASNPSISDLMASEAEQSLLTAAQQEASAKIVASAAASNGGNANSTSATSTVNKGGDNSVASSEAATLSDESLLMAINKLPPETAQKATEAFAERMVALVPNSQQQQAVKANIIAGINEFQKQVEQGHQPGIDLSAIVADAAKEASLTSDVSAALNSRVDAQAGQFMQLMNNAQNSIHQVMQNQLAQVDTTIIENSQLRSEASKPQMQFEGFDKAVNIHKPEGQQQLNEKIRWMVNARNTMAEIRLDPPELGSMQVRVNVQGDAASVSFIVQSQQAKDALADTMPKLRDMLSEQGIELGDAQVRKDNSQNGESGQQLAGQSGNGQGQRGNNDAEFDDDTRVIEQAVTREAKGGIDYYA